MKFKNIFEKSNEAKIIVLTTDFSINIAYEKDQEFIKFTNEKLEIRKYALKHYDKKNNKTIKFYLYNLVSIALSLEGFNYKYVTFNFDHYSYDDELSKELIERIRKLYRKYLPLHNRLVNDVINNSVFKSMFDKSFINNLEYAYLGDFFILGNKQNNLTLLINLNKEVKEYLINVVKDEQTLGCTYIYYILYKNIDIGKDSFLYACTPHEDCLYEDEQAE